jgi:capsular polysaccharide biosynthesis protein
MDLKELFFGLLRNWWVVVLAVLVTTASTVFVGMQKDPIYQATATVELMPSPALADSQMINIINVLSNRRTTINTYARRATSNTVKERVASQLGVSQSVVNGANISANVLAETTLIDIRARANNPQLAADISNAVAQELIRQAPDKVMVFELVDYATPAGTPVEPQITRLFTTGVVTGAVLGGFFALALFLLQRFLAARNTPEEPQTGQVLAGSASK